MGVKERTTYISVPPPPLPEFYMKKQRHEKQSSSSSASLAEVEGKTFTFKETIVSGDGTYDGKPGFVPPTPLTTIPPPPGANDVPPLAIYHICRICLRPRSPRYHREHPIPINGVPPPPGICRRCRVTSVEETKKFAEVVVRSESAPVKIGCITPFVSDKDIVSNEEMRRMKIEKYLGRRHDDRYRSRRRSSSRKDIVYRHVRVVDAPSAEVSDEEETVEEEVEEVILPRKKKVIFTSCDAVNSSSNARMADATTGIKKASTSVKVQPTTNPPSVSSTSVKRETLRKMDSTKASVSARASSTDRAGSTSTVKASAKASARSKSGYSESNIRRVARNEIEQYARTMQQPEQRHAEIRKVAREEVERYRQAERKLEAHPGAFAYGKLVPIEHRIEVECDIAEAMPWKQPAWKEESAAKVSSNQISATEERDFVYEPASDDTKNRSRSLTNSWGPKWRRELSIERRTRYDLTPYAAEGQKVSTMTEAKTTSRTKDWESNRQASVKSREVDEHFQDSNLPHSSSRQKQYILGDSKEKPEAQSNTIEVFEEIDRPPRSRAASYRRYEADNKPRAKPQPPVPERVRELRSEWEPSQGAMRSSPAFQAPDKVFEYKRSESTRNDSGYCNDDATTRTTQARSTKQSGFREVVDPEPEVQPPTSTPSVEYSAHSRVTFQDQASDMTRWSKNHRLAEEGRAGKRLPYPEDNVMPDHSPKPIRPNVHDEPQSKLSRHRGSAKDQDREYVYIERTVQPADKPKGSRPFDGHQPGERVEVEETLVVRRRPQAEDTPRRRRKDRGERPMREGDESHHVKFNKKVEISPTPPGSDASSSEFRSFHSIGPRGGRQMDGNEDPARQGDIVGEYERRGRTRSRDGKARHYHDREMIHERSDGEWTVKPKQKERKGGSRDRQAAWVSGGVPLERPLSESPSREKLISPSRHSKSDGRGPYREDTKVTDSMQAEDGSPGGRTWGDGVGGSLHGSFGQAAQVDW